MRRANILQGLNTISNGLQPQRWMMLLGLLFGGLTSCTETGDGRLPGGSSGEEEGAGEEGEESGEESVTLEADFTATPLAGTAPLLVSFTDASLGSPSTWSWDFGDGGTANIQNPTYLFNDPGVYTVTLNVAGAGQTDDITKTDLIVVEAPALPPNAAFTANPRTGVAPLAVNYTDRSTGAITSYSWDLGDGSVSTEASPTHVYATPGTYTTSLTVTGPGGSDSFTMVDAVIVEAPIPAPIAFFSGTPTNGDAPLTVAFTDLSAGNVSSRSWNFGDGATSSQRNPDHTFTAAGTYSVSLTVTGPGGSDQHVRTDYITVGVPVPPPVAGFSADPMFGPAPLVTTFSDSSSGDISSWLWDFGDGSTSTEVMPTHTYTVPGSYTVTLTVTGAGGTDTEEMPSLVVEAPIPPPVANFSASPASGEAPLSVAFTDLSNGVVTSWNWNFGDGTTSSLPSPQHVYSTPGTYTVVLTAQGPGGEDVATRSGLITVNAPTPPPEVNFSATPTSGQSPLTVQFTDSSTGQVTDWLWLFGDGGSSTERNPSYTYETPGTYTVRLRASGPGGTNILRRDAYITVDAPPPPVAGFIGSPRTGTVPLNVSFSDTSTGAITERLWNFGDGSTSTLRNPSHTYSDDGTYTVSLTVTGVGGSDTQTKVDFITANPPIPPPVAGFTGSPSVGNAPLSVNFTDHSTGQITSRTWDFGDGSVSSAANPTHIYTNPGTYSVQITVVGPGGSDSFTRLNYIQVSAPPPPPVAQFDGSPTAGTAPLIVSFTDHSTGQVTGRTWSFGDGGVSSQANPVHTYANPGSYTVSLTVTGPGGSDTLTQTDFIVVDAPPPAPLAAFDASPRSGDAPLMVDFSDLSSGSVTTRLWDFGDGETSANVSPMHTYTNPGTYTVSLTVDGPGGSDTATQPGYITVNVPIPAPTADFEGTPTSGDAPLSVAFTDLSTGDVTGWTWLFGDGMTSNEQNPTHVYTAAGSYRVRLQASGPGGTDLEVKDGYITVSDPPPAPVAGFVGTPTSGDAPLTVSFTNQSTGVINGYTWLFGDGASSTATNPTHTYTVPGTYTVRLQASGPGGADVLERNGYITVAAPIPPPVAAFTGTPTSGDSPLVVSFTDQSSGSISSWSWTFGDGASSSAQNPAHTYNAAGTYTVALTVTGPGGSDSVTRTSFITVSDPPPVPVASFNAAPTSGDAPLSVAFSDTSSGAIDSWSWGFGDGGGSTAPNPNHVYTDAGTYTVTLTVTGPGGSDTLTRTNLITVDDPVQPPVANFTGTPVSGDSPLTVTFSDTSMGAVNSWTWLFGDGSSSNQQNPTHTYTTAGSYDVRLQVVGPGGNDVRRRDNYITVTAGNPPLAADFSANPTVGMAPLAVSFTDLSTGQVTGRTWNFGDGTTSNAENPSHTYTSNGSYHVSLTVTDGTGTDVKTVNNMITVNNDVSASCDADNARDNNNSLKVGYDYVPVVPDDSLGFYTVYSARRAPGATSGVGNTACIFLFEVGPNEILVFGSGYGNHFVATYDARFDVDHVNEVVEGCLGFDIPSTTVHFFTPHGHEDHVNAPFLKHMENDGYTIAQIAYHNFDGNLVNGLGGWTTSLRNAFTPLYGTTCNAELASFQTPIGKVWFKWRAQHHTNGCIDAILDVEGQTNNRIVIRGSGAGGTCGQNPQGTQFFIKPHGSVRLP